jgi:hypothetical protein
MIGKTIARGFRFSEEQRARLSELKSNEKHPHWKADAASYSAIHKWLVRNYGRANKCDNKACAKTNKCFEYALKNKLSHSHNRDNYLTLCAKCHRSYDTHNKVRIEL